jgi:hypothetical protein
MARLCGKLLQLTCQIGDDGAVSGIQRRAPSGREDCAQLMHNIRAARDVGRVVEDRVAKQHDVRHR